MAPADADRAPYRGAFLVEPRVVLATEPHGSTRKKKAKIRETSGQAVIPAYAGMTGVVSISNPREFFSVFFRVFPWP
jgi:hypothetical protein